MLPAYWTAINISLNRIARRCIYIRLTPTWTWAIDIYSVVVNSACSRSVVSGDLININTLIGATSDFVGSWSSIISAIIAHISVVNDNRFLNVNPIPVTVITRVTAIIDIVVRNKVPAHIRNAVTTTTNINADAYARP
ncbi:hypothetical protein D9M68_741500 [compost metagenome]